MGLLGIVHRYSIGCMTSRKLLHQCNSLAFWPSLPTSQISQHRVATATVANASARAKLSHEDVLGCWKIVQSNMDFKRMFAVDFGGKLIVQHLSEDNMKPLISLSSITMLGTEIAFVTSSQLHSRTGDQPKTIATWPALAKSPV